MNVGGTELNAVRTAERLDRSQFEVQVVTLQPGGVLGDRYQAAGIEVTTFAPGSLYRPRALGCGRALSRWLREQRIDILHAHDIYSNVFAVPWARKAGVRTIASRRWWEGSPGPHWRLATRFGYRCADAVLANSEGIADLLLYEGVPSSRVHVVRNFVEPAAFGEIPARERAELAAGLGLEPEDRVIGVVANLLPAKDHATLLRAIAMLLPAWPRIRLLLTGDGPLRASLSQLAAGLGIADRVIFAGRRPNRPNPHQLHDISVLSSMSEGLPNTILEAMAARRPVVATDVGAVGDAVVDGETGFLVPPRDPIRMATAITRLLADPALARRFGTAGRDRVLGRYTPGAALATLQNLYLRLAGRTATPPTSAEALRTASPIPLTLRG